MTLLRAAGDAVRYARDRGLRRAARKVFRTYVFARERLYVTRNDLLAMAQWPLDTSVFKVRRARPDDPLVEAFGHLKASTVSRWLGSPYFLYVILHEGKLVGLRCLSTGAGPALDAFFRLRPDQLFAVMYYTRPEYRRRGLSRIVKIAGARDLVQRGYRESFATELPTNYDTLIATQRTGSRRLGTLTRTCLFGRVRFALTPTTILSSQLVLRQLTILRQVVPKLPHVGVLFNPSVVIPTSETEPATSALAAELGTKVTFFPVREAADQIGAFRSAFSTARAVGISGLIVFSDPMMSNYRRTIVSLVERLRVPAIFDAKEFVDAGGFMAYGSATPGLGDIESVIAYDDAVRAAVQPRLDRAEPALVVNRKATGALDLVVPSALLARSQSHEPGDVPIADGVVASAREASRRKH